MHSKFKIIFIYTTNDRINERETSQLYLLAMIRNDNNNNNNI